MPITRRNVSTGAVVMPGPEPAAAASRPWALGLDRPAPDTLRIRLAGTWRLRDRLPPLEVVDRALGETSRPRLVVLDAAEVAAWDTGLVAFVARVLDRCTRAAIPVDRRGLPAGVDRLTALVAAVPAKATTPPPAPLSWLARVGVRSLSAAQSALTSVQFLGEATLALARLVVGRAQLRWPDFLGVVQEAGPHALPIVTLISFLLGIILVFTSAVQLRTFGAQIFVADLVAIAAPRDIGCLMTAVIMAGRTGAAFAAQLATMGLNEESDALLTMGIRPMEFLVLPRLLGLIAMMPVLVIYSDLMALLGGGFVAVTMLGLGVAEYADRTVQALTITNVVIGVAKGSVFGVLVALSGCFHGMQAGRSAAAVGLAATSAVVTAIVLIIVAEGVCATLLDALGI
jgi:phospholipid/cholesterol/gamma-HCH transport system permease protein